MNVSDLKTSLSFEINQCTDYNLLYKTFYTITSDRIEPVVRDLFESRGINHETPDFDYFIRSVLYDDEIKRTTPENVEFVKRIINGDSCNQELFSSSYKKKININDQIEGFSKKSIHNLINYIPKGWSGSSIGKGEFAFLVLLNGCGKPKNGGDLNYRNEDIEVKGLSSKMASPSSHLSLMSINDKISEQFQIYKSLPNINGKGFIEYQSMMSHEKLCEFLFATFYNTMLFCTDWKNYLEKFKSDQLYETFRIEQSIFEFNYYKKIDHFDKICFINNENGNIFTTDEMNEELLENFKNTCSYRWNTERIQTIWFSLK